MSYTITLQEIDEVAPMVSNLTFTRPEGFEFTPGQATDFALDQDGWREEERPFTFTGRPDADTLAFTIKSYPDHDGVTKRIPDLKPGDTVLIGDAWGAISDQGPGFFVAGGAGVTPFIPILRARARSGNLEGCTLILADATWDKLILRDEWQAMSGLETVFVLAEEDRPGAPKGHVTREVLENAGVTDRSRVYLCGPPPMEDAVHDALREIGVAKDRVIHEE